MIDDPPAEAGPSSSVDNSVDIVIPSFGLEYWEYRRACFLAGVSCPTTSADEPLPESYTVRPAPPPAPDAQPTTPSRSSSIGRLEALLSEFGAEESDVAWNGGVGGVHRNLSGGKRLAKGLRLGLVIKVLRAGWLRDGTWPLDPRTSRAAQPPPDSPELAAATGPSAIPPLTAASLSAPTSGTGSASPSGAASPAPPRDAPRARQLLPIPLRAGEPLGLRRS